VCAEPIEQFLVLIDGRDSAVRDGKQFGVDILGYFGDADRGSDEFAVDVDSATASRNQIACSSGLINLMRATIARSTRTSCRQYAPSPLWLSGRQPKDSIRVFALARLARFGHFHHQGVPTMSFCWSRLSAIATFSRLAGNAHESAAA
jgi:hypothetical protein